jgi:hypothetical protein
VHQDLAGETPAAADGYLSVVEPGRSGYGKTAMAAIGRPGVGARGSRMRHNYK